MAKKASRSKAKAATLGPDTRIAVLYGPEVMLRKLRLDQLKQTLETAHGEVDRYDFDGASASLAEVFDELRSYSLMATYKLVVVEQADQFVKANRAALERYAQEPVDHATLLLRSDTWHKGKLDKAIEKHGAVIKCEELGPAEAVRWVGKRAEAEHGAAIEAGAAEMLVSYVGTALMRLDGELGKLAAMAASECADGSPTISEKLVDATVARSSDEQAWAMQEALLDTLAKRDASAALDKVAELIDRAGQPEVLLQYAVSDLMRKLAVASSMRAEGRPDGMIGKALRIWPTSRQRAFFAALDRLGPGRASAMLSEALRVDAAGKRGLGEARLNLERFCVRLAG
ncbi:MAG: DNA polymerase III subunit delta [Planctomycetota bacterium]